MSQIEDMEDLFRPGDRLKTKGGAAVVIVSATGDNTVGRVGESLFVWDGLGRWMKSESHPFDIDTE